MAKERIGLFGGTFNPIHSGHLRAGEIIGGMFSLDRVLFIPSHIPPHKSSAAMASAADRFRMVELAVEGCPKFQAGDLEIRTQGKSYSIITLEKVKQLFPEAWFFFILGVDAFLEIKTWRSYETVMEECLFIVMSRPGYRLEDARTVLGRERQAWFCELNPTEKVSEQSFSDYRVFLVSLEALDVSSTEIRRRIHNGEPAGDMVPEPVARYIRENRLYQE